MNIWYTRIAMHLEQNNRTSKTSYGRSWTRLKAQCINGRSVGSFFWIWDFSCKQRWVWCHYTGHGQHRFHGKIHGHVRPAKHSQASSPCRSKGHRETHTYLHKQNHAQVLVQQLSKTKKTNWKCNSLFGSFWTIFVDISHLGAAGHWESYARLV